MGYESNLKSEIILSFQQNSSSEFNIKQNFLVKTLT